MTQTTFLDRETLDRGDLDLDELSAVCGHLRSFGRTSPEAVIDRIGDASVVITNKCVIGAETLDACPQLSLINVVATGVNNIDIDAARERGVTVVNCRGYGTEAVSQHAITLMLVLCTRLIDYHRAVQGGRWAQSPDFCLLDYPIRELAGQTLVVVGYGELGGAVVEKAQALGMEVLIAERPGVETPRAGRVTFDEGVERADILTLHCPLTDATQEMIGPAVLRRMKPTALLINTARGGLIDEPALAQALRTGEIGGAGLDGLSAEPPVDGNALLAPGIPNLIVTPHSAWGSRPARQRIIEQTVENIRAWQGGEPIRCVT
ncbi:2-hydroxyacid dehydrogenase [Spiribacter vilamensis]|uniref:Glycerate dehydrogenase n=1 Tax=Spiribacter vilamensis TaxID=531306 RepID=A0A4Q8D024_9GAMM|nr:2-hydroxyacid dehydrogenase [Spiribacter vilamensis]RZU98550.1 glycerate dehydrogenase [Spiribacter vilamensis]TVO60190.1 2-hydroxyacid dehydrogenase [Spiribacter vilamensis]